jgi:hypothetical protein
VKKAVSVGLSMLLLYHTLAYVLVCIGAWWQAEHDLSEKLRVYRSVDSIVEFQVPLTDRPDVGELTNTTTGGFGYRGHYYSVVSMAVRGDTLFIAGLESADGSFWQSDLLSFLNDHITAGTDSQRKASRFLKFLLKEYSPNPRDVFEFLSASWRATVRIPDVSFVVLARALPIHSPPPRA